MRPISEKSTGILVDELITNAFKTAFAVTAGASTAEFDARYELLRNALEERLGADAALLIHDLSIVMMATWQAQEIVMTENDDTVVAPAARRAQRMNAQRTKIIRQIDSLLGEAAISITTKTYG